MKSFFNKLVKAGIRDDYPVFLKERLYNSNLTTLIFGCILFSYILVFSFLGIYEVAKYAVPFAIMYWLLPFVGNVLGNKLSRILLLVNLNLIIFIYSATLGRTFGIHYWFIASVQITFYVFDLKEYPLLITSALLPISLFTFLRITEYEYDFFSHMPISAFIETTMNSLMLVGSLATTFAITYKVTSNYSKTKISETQSLRHVFDHYKALDASSIVVVTDPKGRIIHVNDQFCRLSGHSPKELLGNTYSLINSGYHPPEFFRDMWTTVSSGKVWRGEICNRSKSGELFWLLTTINPILNLDNKVEKYVSIRHDITQNKLLQLKIIEVKEARESELVRELKASQSQIIQSAKLASLGVMSSGLAHEINNPLTFIKGFNRRIKLSLEKHGQVTSKDIGEMVKQIDEAADRIAYIVQYFRDYSRTSGLDRQKVMVNDVLRRSFTLFNSQLKLKEIVVEFKLDASIPYVRGDIVQLEQVFFNLITNARDALTKKQDDAEKKIQVSSRENAGFVEITFTDNGTGILEGNLEQIFDPFFTTKDVGEGTGLGLSIIHRIITEHSGKITVDSIFGQGTTFTVQIPIHPS